MLTFLFWNLNRKPLVENIVRLVALHSIDVVIVAESQLASGDFLQALASVGRFHDHSNLDCPRIQVFANFPSENTKSLHANDRCSVFSWNFRGKEIIFATAHLPSLLGYTEKHLNSNAELFAEEIRKIELEQGHFRTIVIGDLNLNPFSSGIVSAKGLHGVSTRQRAEQQQRTIQGRLWPFLYNPMWRFFGDGSLGPPGTFHRTDNEFECYFWHIFDQVLIRPDLLSVWKDDSLQILTGDGVVDFWKEDQRSVGGPNGSDHLPILFQLDLKI